MKIVGGQIASEEVKGETTQFSIKNSAHAIHVLSTSLYKDPVTAVIRELLCNAYDAHKANDTLHIPIEMTIPRRAGDIFRVRDFGTGMEPREIESLYTTYFDSTKDQGDDDSTGYFGLGSKSPFSCTKEFTVKTYYYGVVHIYTAFIDKNTRMPSIKKVRTEGTSEENGIEIEFKAFTQDAYGYFTDWEPRAQNVVYAFPKGAVKVVNSNIKYKSIEDDTAVERPDWLLSKHYSATGVLVGNIMYPLRTEDFTRKYANMLNSFSFVLKCKPSEVEVTPSREELHLNDATMKSLQGKMDIFEKEYKETLEGIAKDYKSLWEARKQYPVLQPNSNSMLPGSYLYEKGVKPSPYKFPADRKDIPDNLVTTTGMYRVYGLEGEVREYSSDRYGRGVRVKKNVTLYHITNPVFCVVYADTSGPLSRIKEWMKDHEGAVYYTQEKEVAEELARRLGMPDELLRPSSWFPAVSVDRARVTGSKSKILKYIGQQDKAANATAWKEAEVDMDEGGVYVEVRSFKVKYPDKDMSDSRVLNAPKVHLGTDIIGVRTSALKKFQDHPEWMTIAEALQKKKEEWEASLPLDTLRKIRYSLNGRVSWLASFYAEHQDKLLFDSPLMERIYKDNQKAKVHTQNLVKYENLITYLGEKPYGHDKPRISSVKVREKIDNLYPLLSKLLKTSDKIHYINLVDKCNHLQEKNK